MPTWPSTLPQSPLLNGFQEKVPDTRLRSQMDQGPAKMRHRTSIGIRTLDVEYLLHKNDIALLENFYMEDIGGGVLAFDYTHPRTKETVSCRFIEPPAYTPTNGLYFKTHLKLEIIP